MCPHCGQIVKASPLVATHDWPIPCRQVCPGIGQIPRCAESDARPLWNGEPNPHFGKVPERPETPDYLGDPWRS